MKKVNKRLLSLVVAVMYALCILVAAPIQASASAPGTHELSRIYTATEKAACKKAALIALAKLPSSTTIAKYYDNYYEFTLLKTRYFKAYNAIYRAKNMGMNYKAFKNYYRLAIAHARYDYLTAKYNYYVKPVVTAVKALPNPVTLLNEAAVAAANKKYNALSAAMKKLVPASTKTLLTAAVTKIADFKVYLDSASVSGQTYTTTIKTEKRTTELTYLGIVSLLYNLIGEIPSEVSVNGGTTWFTVNAGNYTPIANALAAEVGGGKTWDGTTKITLADLASLSSTALKFKKSGDTTIYILTIN